MRIIIVCFCLIGSLLSVSAQDYPLTVCEIKADASLPFYEIKDMAYYQARSWNSVTTQRQDYNRGLWSLNTYDLFSLLDGEISNESKENLGLMKGFEISVYQKNTPTRYKHASFAVLLKEKDWMEQKNGLQKRIEEALQQQFSAYKLTIEIKESRKKEKTFLMIKVLSKTGGNEFETSEMKKQRVAKMKTEVKPVLSRLLSTYHTQRLWKLQRTVIEPYRAALRAKHDPRKLDTITIDIQELGTYSADKEQFLDVKCSDGWTLKNIGIPLEQAKVMREAPEQYQIKAYLFKGRRSHPWNPNHDLTAFSFYEVVHKETQKIFVRTYAYFNQSSTQKHYRYELIFPQY